MEFFSKEIYLEIWFLIEQQQQQEEEKKEKEKEKKEEKKVLHAGKRTN